MSATGSGASTTTSVEGTSNATVGGTGISATEAATNMAIAMEITSLATLLAVQANEELSESSNAE